MRPARLSRLWLGAGVIAVAIAFALGLALGPVNLPLSTVLDALAGNGNERDIAIVTQIRLPRVLLGLMVGAMLALAGGCFQGVFRNPLADPYLLGVAAGAGLGATVAIGMRSDQLLVPAAAFTGAIAAVIATYALGRGKNLILAGVAVSAFAAAVQTYLLQRNVDTIREVYSWLLGRLATNGYHEVKLLLPYAIVTSVVVLAMRRELDVLSVGDAEASGLGLHPQRSRMILLAAAALGTAAAVAVSGLIGFVGIVVPHIVRLLAGGSYRQILPLSLLFGAAFLALADLVARTLISPGELPIGVVTAFFGAPFFVLVLRTTKGVSL
ncbi:ABC transporter permease [Rhizocola hellebori]|uniref:ABC transporter permease n=1 Tax=Rhizocola hellebori TaxID=1392758 RepID=A0A8J3QLQ9_9ACTN|nr:iron ABC transporter permease [Rhizocola hellebori]GIH11768.1 ABC transporter permease [Rhizocola hellebori]